jgi:hypothetical protein
LQALQSSYAEQLASLRNSIADLERKP